MRKARRSFEKQKLRRIYANGLPMKQSFFCTVIKRDDAGHGYKDQASVPERTAEQPEERYAHYERCQAAVDHRHKQADAEEPDQ